MRVLVTGCNGQLGFELCRKGVKQGFDVIGCDLPQFDITNSKAVKETIEVSECDLIINAAAYTAVDRAEDERDLAYKVNCIGPFNLALACARLGIPLIHVSTDYVFDGSKDGPHQVSDPISPINVYGETKAAGEEKIKSALREYIISA